MSKTWPATIEFTAKVENDATNSQIIINYDNGGRAETPETLLCSITIEDKEDELPSHHNVASLLLDYNQLTLLSTVIMRTLELMQDALDSGDDK